MPTKIIKVDFFKHGIHREFAHKKGEPRCQFCKPEHYITHRIEILDPPQQTVDVPVPRQPTDV